ncbi:hypothetical protein L7F22_068830 [Adiantum nelumboides]|nr:hypothetical protein [Adiantum nelumboides]
MNKRHQMPEKRITRSTSKEHQIRIPAAAPPQTSNPNSQHNSQFHHSGYIKGLSGLIHEAEMSTKEAQLATMRNMSEELLIKSLVEGIPAHSMEGLGFANIPQTGRIDSEELFHSWMSLGEGQTAGQLQHPRQNYSRRSNEFAFLLSQQTNEIPNAVENIDQYLQTNNFFLEEAAGENGTRNAEGDTICATEASQLKWFPYYRPMTRSHSSELRRRYAAMQESSSNLTDHNMKQMSSPIEALAHRKFHQLSCFPHFPHSALSPNRGHLGEETISSFVNLLKGTLERKRMGKGNSQQQRWPQSSGHLSSMVQGSQNQIPRSQQGGFSESSYEGHGQVQNLRQIVMEGQVPNVGVNFAGDNQHQTGLPSHARSPSESSVGAREDPCNSGQTTPLKRPAKDVPDLDQQPKRQNSITTNYSADNGEAVKEIQQTVGEKKLPYLARMGSATSSGGSDLMDEKNVDLMALLWLKNADLMDEKNVDLMVLLWLKNAALRGSTAENATMGLLLLTSISPISSFSAMEVPYTRFDTNVTHAEAY